MAAKKRPVCGTCRHSETQHQGQEGCWGQGEKPWDQCGCQEFVGEEAPAAKASTMTKFVGHAHPGTALAMERKSLPRMGSLKRVCLELIKLQDGMTDDELEYATGKSHQSVSAARNNLMNDGLIVDSGRRRKTRYDNEAIVWTAVLT